MKDAIHIVVDLETLGTGPKAPIMAIGAVCFHMESDAPADMFYRTVKISSALVDGFEVEGDTIEWWMQQSEKARQALFDDPSELWQVLRAFALWVRARYGSMMRGPHELRVWGNGAAFDNVILRNAYKSCLSEVPWNFRVDRDLRTILELYPKADQGLFEGTQHNALDDAKHEAKILKQALELHYSK